MIALPVGDRSVGNERAGCSSRSLDNMGFARAVGIHCRAGSHSLSGEDPGEVLACFAAAQHNDIVPLRLCFNRFSECSVLLDDLSVGNTRHPSDVDIRFSWFRADPSVVAPSNLLQLVAGDPDLLAAKGGQHKTVEPFIICSAIIAEQAKSLFLAHEKAIDTIGTVMNPSRVAAQRDIVGKLVNLIAKRQWLSFPRHQV
jgi:hypothetical protein